MLQGSLADSFHLPPKQVGCLAPFALAAILVGTLGAPVCMNRLNWRWLTALGAIGCPAGAPVLSFLLPRKYRSNLGEVVAG